MLSGGMLRLVVEAGLVAKLVLLVLLLFSVVSWAIIGRKLAELRLARRQTDAFLELFRTATKPGQIYRQVRGLRVSPLAALFCTAHEFLVAQNQRHGSWAGEREDLYKLLEGLSGEQVGRLERRLPFLATVANVSPFIGLLGTVWGIMAAFRDIGLQGAANLAVVAPGIAEALVATAAGLAAAIPAVVAYNYFNARINGLQCQLERFAPELAAVLATGREARSV